jgi:hypothetical protein
MSATQSRSGASALKSRRTRSGAVVAARCAGRGTGAARRRRWTPTRPASRMSRATRLRPTRQPSARRAAWTRGDPYVPRLATWTARIAASRAASAATLPVAGPRAQAR